MYVVFAEELDEAPDAKGHIAQSLEEAFAQIVSRCGYAHHFEQEQEGWKLVLTDVGRPACNPDPVITSYKRPRDAKYDLMAQAVDGRLRGHIAMTLQDFENHRRIASRQIGGDVVAAYER